MTRRKPGRFRTLVFAALYDRILSVAEKRGLRGMRRDLLAAASGRVLEIGAGTGLNADHWPDAVTSLTLTEPEPAMATRLRERLAERADWRDTEVVECEAEDLPFGDSSFDTVVSTLVLCTVADLGASLSEVRRVLRPGGAFLFLEHVRSEDEGLARWQERLNPLQRWIALGCECDRRTVDAIRAAGFVVERCEHGEMPAAYAIVRPLAIGVAVRPAQGVGSSSGGSSAAAASDGAGSATSGADAS